MPESVSLVQERQYRMRAIELVLLELILSVTLFLLTLGQEVCDFGDGSGEFLATCYSYSY